MISMRMTIMMTMMSLTGFTPSFLLLDPSSKANPLSSSSSTPNSYSSVTSDGVDDSTDSCTGFDSGLFFSGAGLLNGLTIAIAFPLKVFLNDLATLLLLDAEDFVDFESESESESAGLLFDLVGSLIGNDGLSTSSTSSSSF